MLKKILISLLTLIITVFFIVPLFLPSKYNVERSIVIKKDRSDIYSRLVNLESWSEWSPWYAMEPNADYQFNGIIGVVGSSSSWKGDKIGAGKQTITKLISPEYIETDLEFTKPNTVAATGYWRLSDESEGSTLVLWGMKGSLAYPMGRLMGCFMDGMIGKDFENGLKQLKAVSEQ